MQVRTIARVAIRSLRRSPLRSVLTALGVIVGVAAVVTTTSIGAGAKAKIEELLSKPDSRIIFLSAQAPSLSGKVSALERSDRLTSEDYHAVRSSIAGVDATSPRIFLPNAHVKAKGHSVEVIAEGIGSDGFTTLSRKLTAGTVFDEIDVARAANVCVISDSLARTLYSGDIHDGPSLLLNGTTFTVIGIVDDVESLDPSTFGAQHLHIYIPFTSLIRRLDPTAIMNISIQAQSIAGVESVQRDVNSLMMLRRHNRRVEFLTATATDSLRTYSESSLTAARLLAAIGAIALVVGGIGIMNIMLVSVTERTREIGIRLAVGTRAGDILGQFLTEAIALSLVGGLVGIVLGAVAARLVMRLNDWPTEINASSIFAALLCSLGVGALFGYHPAHRAATMRPVEALRDSA
jgi:putative ABC transport system permease protein